jgi:hypothetical protein
MPIDEAKIMSAVGKPVKFTYPAPGPTAHGVLKRRTIAWSDSTPRPSGASYCDVVDTIEFPGRPELWLRVGYYRQSADGKQKWASQTTICEPLSIWRKILPAIVAMMENESEQAA